MVRSVFSECYLCTTTTNTVAIIILDVQSLHICPTYTRLRSFIDSFFISFSNASTLFFVSSFFLLFLNVIDTEFRWKNKGKKDCEWVAKKKWKGKNVCKKKGKFRGESGKIRDYCLETCNQC